MQSPRAKWTKADDERLEYLLSDLGLSPMAIGFLLDRTERGVEDRMKLLGLSKRKLSPRRVRAAHEVWIKIRSEQNIKISKEMLQKEIQAGREEIARNDVKPFKKWF